MTDTLRLSERIKSDSITCTSAELAGPPAGETDAPPDMRWFDVTLHMEGREFSIPFGLMPLAGNQPGVADVMSLITMGVRSVVHNRDYREWCDEWGFDPEDEKKKAMFAQWERMRNRLLVFLGGKFDAYMDETQDDI